MTCAKLPKLCIIERARVNLIHADQNIFVSLLEPIFTQYARDTCVGVRQSRSYQTL